MYIYNVCTLKIVYKCVYLCFTVTILGGYIMHTTLATIGNLHIVQVSIKTLNKENGCNLNSIYNAELTTAYYVFKLNSDGDVMGKSINFLMQRKNGNYTLCTPYSNILVNCTLFEGLHNILTQFVDY